ncbi:MAG: ATP-binding protein [Terriglobales bacterium]
MSTAAVPVPKTLEALGIRRSILEDLALKTVYMNGEISLQELSTQMCVNTAVAEELFGRLRKDQLCEVTGMTGVVYRTTTTTAGKTRALELLALNQYTGPAPVSLQDYSARVRQQSIRRMAVRPPEVARAFQHLVLDDCVLTQVGTALTSGRAIFLYGPTGTGKTSIAEAMTEIFRGESVWLPYAVEVDGQIITVYDPHLHPKTTNPSPDGSDPRWVICKRPRVMVGGELTIEMLDLQFNPVTKYYAGPLQMKANNGLLIIDDFGRQRVRPDELLNRWVVPLDRQVDFLALTGGKKIEIPFDMFVVFATNLDPAKLVDPAFLRRIQTKIKLDCIGREQFHAIFSNVCREMKVLYDPAMCDYAIENIRRLGEPLRPCHPRDLVSQVCWAAKYEGREPSLNAESVAQACVNYFITPETP